MTGPRGEDLLKAVRAELGTRATVAEVAKARSALAAERAELAKLEERLEFLEALDRDRPEVHDRLAKVYADAIARRREGGDL